MFKLFCKNTARYACMVLALISPLTYSQELDSFGWEKSIDDFDGTVSFTKTAGMGISVLAGYNCEGLTASQAIGAVGEVGFENALLLAVYLGGQEDPNEIKEFSWRTEDGIQSIVSQCSREYSSGSWNTTCWAAITSKDMASSISTSDFIRLVGQRTNIDLTEGSCASLYSGIKVITSDYSKSD